MVADMTRRGWGVGAVVGAAVLLVTACGGDPEPVVSPSATPSVTVSPSVTPSPSPSPSATALTEDEVLAAIPEAARVESFPGAQAFAEYFLDQASTALVKRDSGAIDVLADEECVYCANVRDSIASLEEAGSTVSGGDSVYPWEVASGGLQSDGTWAVRLRAETAPIEVTSAAGDTTVAVPAESADVTVALRWQVDRWQVLEVVAEVA